MQEKQIKFPNRINRYRLITMFEADVVFVALGVFVSVFVVSFFLGAKGIVPFSLALGISFIVVYLYSVYKEKSQRGFLFHWLYTRALYKKKYAGYEGLPENFLPEGYENEFVD